ncbi:hypothetical protein IVA98_05610 [Bradyrhizobium sp. 160]|nr:hypothetical protein [Bradyrhizobium sp. 160]MCK1622730.1 hypothetical protein [Bradyrhizobium sp. 160]
MMPIISGLQSREKTLPIKIAAPLILTHACEFGFSFGCILVLALQINN